MRIPLAAAVLLAAIVTNSCAPLKPVPGPEDVHRDSTQAILDLEQELKKAAGEDKKPRPAETAQPGAPVPAGVADEALVKELAEHEADLKGEEEQAQPEQDKSEDDSAEEELQQEKAVAEKAAELKAEQEEETEKEEEQLKDAVENQEPVGQPEEASEAEEEAAEEAVQAEEPAEEEEELQSLQVPGNMNDLYEDYLNEQMQRQAYYNNKRAYGEDLENLAEEEGSKDMFVASLLQTIREHPEILDEMRTGGEEEPEQPQFNYNEEPGNDREEALQAEYLAATRGQPEPTQFESYESAQPYQGPLYETNEVRPQENYQNYPSDKMAKVVAKKWGYSAPEEYFGMADDKENLGAAAPLEQEEAKRNHHEETLEEPQHMEPIM